MKVRFSIAVLLLAAAPLRAQQKTPPTRPVPPARPLPAPRPLPEPNLEWQLQAQALADQAREQARQALQSIDVQQLQEQAQLATQNIDVDQVRQQAREAAEQAREMSLENFDSRQMRDQARELALQAQTNIDWTSVQDAMRRARMNFDLSGLGGFDGDEHFAHSPRAPWAQDDPADSLYRMAREAFNRGDWRRAADVFHEIVQKYPNSAYVPDCAYYEAFSRYRIGTTEELHQALALLSDQKSSTSRHLRRADVAGLAARIRGALAARGDKQAAAQIAQDAEKSGGCDREEMSVRAEALNALGQMDPATAVPLLRRVLARTDTCSLVLRRSALFMLVRRGDTVATDALVAVATNEREDTELRADAINYLGRMPGPKALNAIEGLVKTSHDDQIQRAAVYALAQNDNPSARTSVRGLIERSDLSEALRASAIRALASRDASDDDAAYLRAAYAKMPSERLKQTILSALARIGGSANEQFLLSVARNPSESSVVRGTAISYAGRQPTVSVEDLSRLYDTSESRNLREQIIGVLGRRSEPAAADKLMEIAKTGTDPNTRRDAISVLSRKKDDPRVTKFLLDLVGR